MIPILLLYLLPLQGTGPGQDVPDLDPRSGGPGRHDGERLLRVELPPSPAEEAFRAEHPDATFPPAGVYTIHRDRRGHVWFGTASVGLCRFDGQQVAWMYERDLSVTTDGGAFGIRSIHEDREGRFWITGTASRFTFAREVRHAGGFTLLEYDWEGFRPLR